jgi:D-serine deaminase-like pyridoxal phosphate-dependent protein
MIDYSKIKRPAILLDEAKCRENIRKMTSKAKAAKVIFRPHFKKIGRAHV